MCQGDTVGIRKEPEHNTNMTLLHMSKKFVATGLASIPLYSIVGLG